jgi:hypothetical protein
MGPRWTWGSAWHSGAPPIGHDLCLAEDVEPRGSGAQDPDLPAVGVGREGQGDSSASAIRGRVSLSFVLSEASWLPRTAPTGIPTATSGPTPSTATSTVARLVWEASGE